MAGEIGPALLSWVGEVEEVIPIVSSAWNRGEEGNGKVVNDKWLVGVRLLPLRDPANRRV